MNAEQLGETTMDPASRILLQITVDEAEEADKLFRTLMGEDVSQRRHFIMTHAKGVKEIDLQKLFRYTLIAILFYTTHIMKNRIWALALIVVTVALFFVYQDNVKLRNSLDLIDQAVSTSTILTDTVRNNRPTTGDSMTGNTMT